LAWKSDYFRRWFIANDLVVKGKFASIRRALVVARTSWCGRSIGQGCPLPRANWALRTGSAGRAETDVTASLAITTSCRLTLSPQSETVVPYKQAGDVIMRVGVWAIFGVIVGVCSLTAVSVQAQTTPQRMQLAQTLTPDDLAARPAPVARPSRRLRVYPRAQVEADGVYPRYNPGPNAVRVCNASYAQEYRPSGTVIVPHMTCVWR
jgi:hypothetical protein